MSYFSSHQINELFPQGYQQVRDDQLWGKILNIDIPLSDCLPMSEVIFLE